MNLRGKRIKPARTHKFLGVIVDDKLRWNEHAKYAIAKATKYVLMFGRLTRPSTGLNPEFMTRLYEAVAVPKMTYAAEVWITGATRTSPTDVIEIHAGLLPVGLLLDKICHRYAVQLAALPKTHPLHKMLKHAIWHNVSQH
ncbi:hypothetical protein J132_03466 [Termitomyces sp. J132]|nr:hypothetical protein J132_03466 [Termitomyces sp. J132]